MWQELFCAADRPAVTGAYAEHTMRQLERSLASGIWGWFDDDVALVADWGFELDQVAAPVYIWHGAEDQFVPLAHAEWLARHVPGSKAHLHAAEGTSRWRSALTARSWTR